MTIINFLQFFIWGAYLTSIGGYMYATLHFKGEEIGAIFLTLGIASVFMPPILGIISDRWVNAERLLGITHIIGAAALYYASTIDTPSRMFWAMLLVCATYMPTISLNNTVSYHILKNNGLEPQKYFPPIRVWGTIGFIAAMWLTDLFHWTLTATQLVFAAVSALVTGLYCFTLPPCKPDNKGAQTLAQAFGIEALKLFKIPKMAIFFIFSLFLGAALQITNQWGVPFIDHFKFDPAFANTAGVKYPNILISISQISETVFIVTIPFFLRKYGIKTVMLMSMFAWFLRFGLFGIGDPGGGLFFLILSMIVYGMAFDFFNISGSLFIEREAPAMIRGSAQGLFMMMTNGIGAMIGSFGSGWLIQHYTEDNGTNWKAVWFIFAAYAFIIGIIFMLVFRYRHTPDSIQQPAVH
ncbi:nucleoside permease [Niabella ginsenosidivorans]|uniref:nucleoside permease n=1 Tax=Niabella ginsenosidivorans TaxID=1176587 RepID=UPI002936E8D6|nr:nucleoside permease [Niabella ginsenosidivorans]